MAMPDTMRRMPGRREPIEGPLTQREAVGVAAKEILEYKGLSQAGIARSDHKMSVKSLSRIMAGDPAVGTGLLRSLAGILKLPAQTFILIADNDVTGIEQLVMLRPEEDEHFRRLILGIMARIDGNPRRRATDT